MWLLTPEPGTSSGDECEPQSSPKTLTQEVSHSSHVALPGLILTRDGLGVFGYVWAMGGTLLKFL